MSRSQRIGTPYANNVHVIARDGSDARGKMETVQGSWF